MDRELNLANLELCLVFLNGLTLGLVGTLFCGYRTFFRRSHLLLSFCNLFLYVDNPPARIRP